MNTVPRRLACSVFLTLAPTLTALAEEKFVRSKVPDFPAPQADRALVYIVRPDFVRLIPNPTFEVFVDDTPIGYLPQRSYLAAQVEPGRRRLWGPPDNEPASLDLQKGFTYLLVLTESYGPNRILMRTSWRSGDPADIHRLVDTAKLSCVTTTQTGMLELEREARHKKGSAPVTAAPPQPVVLPVTFTKVWYRSGDRAPSLVAYDASGVLTVDANTVRFESAKKTFEIRTASIRSVSLDKMSANPFDGNQWGIVRFGEGSADVAGFMDGHKLGHGGDTERIYRALSAAADAAGQAAQSIVRAGDDLPAGSIRYQAFQDQFTMMIPQDWMAYDQSEVLKGAAGRFGLIFFLPSASFVPHPRGTGSTLSEEVAIGLSRGDIPSFFVQREPAREGMSCSGFSDRATKEILSLIADEDLFGKGAQIAQAPQAVPMEVAGCSGLRLDGSSQPPGGPQWTVRTYAVSDGETLFLFALRNLAENYVKNSPVFEQIVATISLPRAQ